MRQYLTIFMFCLMIPYFLISDADDFGFKPIRRKLRYVEEFYQLYTQNHMAATDATERNLVYLQYALNSPYIHPIQALCEIKTREEHEKYKIVLRTRIAFLLAKGFVQLGYRYDKEDIYFFNLEFYEDLLESFGIARYYYNEAIVYWEEAVKMAEKLMESEHRRVRLRGALIEDMINEAEKIFYGDITYRKIIDFRIRELERKKEKMRELADNS